MNKNDAMTKLIYTMYCHYFREEFFLELVCRNQLMWSKTVDSQIKLLQQGINWDRMYRLIVQNRLSLFFQNIPITKSHNNALIPIKTKIDKEGIINKILAVRQLRRSAQIIRLFKQKKIDFVVMKTFPYIQSLYRGKPIKIANDVDILLPLPYFGRASEILFQNGYKYAPNDVQGKLSNTIEGINFFKPKGQEVFVKQNHVVELHTRIIDDVNFISPIDSQRNLTITFHLFQGAFIRSFFGIKIKVFSPNDLIIGLFLHSLYQHNLQSEISYIELVSVIKHESGNISWKYICKILRKYDLLTLFMWYLELINLKYPKMLPAEIQKKLTVYQSHLKFHQILLLQYMKYSSWHPVRYGKEPWKNLKEGGKEWMWACINNALLSLTKIKLKKILSSIALFLRSIHTLVKNK